MAATYKKGDKVYIIESMGKKIICTVVSSAAGFTIVRLPSGGAIRLRDSRIFPCEEDAPTRQTPEIKSPGYRDPHAYMDTKSKYGP